MKHLKLVTVSLLLLMVWAVCPADAMAGGTDHRRTDKRRIHDFKRGHRPRDAKHGHHHPPRRHDFIRHK